MRLKPAVLSTKVGATADIVQDTVRDNVHEFNIALRSAVIAE